MKDDNSNVTDWRKLDVRGKMQMLLATENFDGAAAPSVREEFQKATQLLASDPAAALTHALETSIPFDEGREKYNGAKRRCDAYGDLTTMLKKDCEAAQAMSRFLKQSNLPGHTELAMKADQVFAGRKPL